MKPAIYKFTALYLGALLAWGAVQFGDLGILAAGIAIAALYALFDILWTYFRDGVWYQPWASVISGFIIALIGLPKLSWELIIFLPLTAVILKQLVKIGPRRHIFNPAASALAVVSLAGFETVSWWGVAWGKPILIVLTLAGLYILWQIRRWETALAFLALYALFFGARQVFDGTVIFFASVMLIEHVTSNFPGRRNKIIYGVVVALGVILASIFLKLDPLIFGLLAGNLIMSMLTLLL